MSIPREETTYQILMENLQAGYHVQPSCLQTRWYQKFKERLDLHRSVERTYNKYTPELRAKIGRMGSVTSSHATAVQYTYQVIGGKCTREHCTRNCEVISRIVC